MFGSNAKVHFSAQIFGGCVYEKFDQCDRVTGLGRIMDHLPEAADGVCKALCMHWVDHHANDREGRFSNFARQMGSGGNRRQGGSYGGVSVVLSQLAYGRALAGVPAKNYEHAKDQFTDDFLRKRGIVRQMDIKYPTRNLTPSEIKIGSSKKVNAWFGRKLAKNIVGVHSAHYWSYKIISLHGRAGGHGVAAFVGADAMFFDPNYGIFYFENADYFRQWMGEPGGFYWASGYVKEFGDDFVIKSYAKRI